MDARAAHLRVVAHAAQQAVGNARRAARAQRNLRRAVGVDGNLHHLGGALDDDAQFLFGVKLQAQQNAEARAQRRTQQAGPRGGADERERPNLHHMRARRRSLPDDDVQLVILERGVELLFEHRLHAVNLVEKQHLALAQIGEDRGQVALDLQRRPRGLLKAHVELVGNDGGQRGLAQPRRAEEQHVIQRLAARFRRLKRDRQLFLGLGLADELAAASADAV